MAIMEYGQLKAVLSAMFNGIADECNFTRKELCEILEELAEDYRY